MTSFSCYKIFLEPVSVPGDPNVRTIYDVLLRGSIQSNNGLYLGECKNGKYSWLNYKTVICKQSLNMVFEHLFRSLK